MNKKIVDKLLNTWLMRFYYFKSLPGAWFFGLKLVELNDEKAVVQIPYRWSTQNPFQSIYFAAISAAAELSTGSIALAGTEGKNMSMLVTRMEGRFIKKAKGTIRFECAEVAQIISAIKRAEELAEGTTVLVNTIGKNLEGLTVAEFSFEWSFRRKSN